MVLRSLGLTLLLFILFSLALHFFHGSAVTGQYQFQQNVIKGQRYRYGQTAPEKIVLGTSLSNNLLLDSIDGLYNLALPGLHVTDGFHILAGKAKAPATIFIETNFCTLPANPLYTGMFDSRAGNTLKTELPALQEGNQPIGIFRYLTTKIHGGKKAAASKDTLANTIPVKADVFQELLKDSRKRYINIDTASVDTSLASFVKEVDRLAAGGSRVYLFEIPVDSSLEHLPYSDYVRDQLQQKLAGHPGVSLLRFPEYSYFRTVDGIHLNPYSARIFTATFKAKTDSIARLRP